MAKENRGGARVGAGREKLNPLDKKYPVMLQIPLRKIITPKSLDRIERNELIKKSLEKTKKKLILRGIIKN